MPMSDRTRDLLLAPFAISPIIGRFALPALIGALLFGAGVWQQATWPKVIGVVLAAPILWACAVLFFVYFPILLFEAIRSRLR
jgi:hypothetical protein